MKHGNTAEAQRGPCRPKEYLWSSLVVTGIQLASALGALANGGAHATNARKRIVDSDGHVLKDYQPQVARQVVSENRTHRSRPHAHGR